MTEPTPLPRPIMTNDRISIDNPATEFEGKLGWWIEAGRVHRANAAIAAGAQYEYIAAERIGKLAEYEARHDADQRLIERHREDFAKVAAALLEEAVRREWCSDYDTFVAKVNEELRYNKLLSQAGAWDVRHEYTVVISGTVIASNQDEADDLAVRQYHQLREAMLFLQPSRSDVNDSMDFCVDEVTYQHDGTNATKKED